MIERQHKDVGIKVENIGSKDRVFKLGKGALTLFCTAAVVGVGCSPSSQEASAPIVPNIPDITTPDTFSSKWEFTCIDTMKISRDRAREDLSEENINYLVSEVAKTGASHIAIGTPYDEEFDVVLRQWVKAARDNNLNVWFRGNFSGWEGWFDYDVFSSPQEHFDKTKAFITDPKHAELFREGDIFTPAPEPENSRVIGSFWENQEEYRKFLVGSYNVCKEAFTEIGMVDKVNFGYFSMNGDVAKYLTKEVVEKIGGRVVIDHYVADSDGMGQWIKALRNIYGNDVEVIIGEFGAPIPDLNGDMTEEEQAKFVELLLKQMLICKATGINYWGLMDGSTAILNYDGTEREVFAVLEDYFVLYTAEATHARDRELN